MENNITSQTSQDWFNSVLQYFRTTTGRMILKSDIDRISYNLPNEMIYKKQDEESMSQTPPIPLLHDPVIPLPGPMKTGLIDESNTIVFDSIKKISPIAPEPLKCKHCGRIGIKLVKCSVCENMDCCGYCTPQYDSIMINAKPQYATVCPSCLEEYRRINKNRKECIEPRLYEFVELKGDT